MERKRNEVKAEKMELTADLNSLQETHLLYARMIHQFSQEIAKNEVLLGCLPEVS